MNPYLKNIKQSEGGYPKIQLVSWVDYIISHNPKGCLKVLYNFGYYAPLNDSELREAVYLGISEHRSDAGNPFIEKLLLHHPDLDMLKEVYNKQKKVTGTYKQFAEGAEVLQEDERAVIPKTEVKNNTKEITSAMKMENQKFLNIFFVLAGSIAFISLLK